MRREHNNLVRFGKTICSGFIAGMMALSLVSVPQVSVRAAETSLQSPRIVKGDENEYGNITQTVTYDCIYFGSYPQAEVVPSEEAETTVEKFIQNGQDYVVDEDTYNYLQTATGWDENGVITYNNQKYRRVCRQDATHGSWNNSSFNWANDNADGKNETIYHYFIYQPIKWRVLEVKNNQALLLADMALDEQPYNEDQDEVTWKTSTMRSFLNSYSEKMNQDEIDYSLTGFVTAAFDEKEQSVIQYTNVINEDNREFRTDAGEDTIDRVFLLSEEEAYGRTAIAYGFENTMGDDIARRATSTTYAKAKGCSSYGYNSMGKEEDFSQCCDWWLRSPGDGAEHASSVYAAGWIYNYRDGVANWGYGVRPAMRIDVSASDIYTTAAGITITNECSTCEHDYKARTKRTASCVAEGIRQYYCNLCGDLYEEIISKDSSNHVGGTEVRDGVTYCKSCGAKLSSGNQNTGTENGNTPDNTQNSTTNPVQNPAQGNVANTEQAVTKQQQNIATAKISTYKAAKCKKKNIKINLKAKAQGKLTYKVSKYPAKCKKYISVSKKGVVTLKKGIKKGIYKITITAAATDGYDAAAKVITIKVK